MESKGEVEVQNDIPCVGVAAVAFVMKKRVVGRDFGDLARGFRFRFRRGC